MIRRANKFDLVLIKQFMQEFVDKTNHPLAIKKDHAHIDKVLSTILAGLGFVLIDEQHGGLLIAIKNPVLWEPDAFVLTEVWWSARKKTSALALLKEFVSIAETMQDNGEIRQFYFNAYGAANYRKYGIFRISMMWGSHG